MSSQNGKNNRVRSGPKTKRRPRSTVNNQVVQRREFLQKKRSNPGQTQKVPTRISSRSPLPTQLSSRTVRTLGPRTYGTLLPHPKFPSQGTEAPLAVSSSVTHRALSISGDMYSSMTVKSCAPFCEVGDFLVPGTYPVGCLGLPGYISSSTPQPSNVGLNNVTLSPFLGHGIRIVSPSSTTTVQSMNYPINSQVTNLVSNFSQWEVLDATLHYEPNASANTDRAYIISWSADPCHPNYGIPGYYFNAESSTFGTVSAKVPPGPINLENNTCVAFFGAWNAWSMPLPVVRKPHFTYTTPVYTGALLYGNYNVPLVRDTQWGCLNGIAIAGNGNGTRSGRLWIEATYRFFDPTPTNIATGLTTPTLVNDFSRFLHPHHQLPESKEESKEVKEDDYDLPEVVSPPRFAPLPTSVPGSGLYIPCSTPSSQSSSSSQPYIAPKKATSMK